MRCNYFPTFSLPFLSVGRKDRPGTAPASWKDGKKENGEATKSEWHWRMNHLLWKNLASMAMNRTFGNKEGNATPQDLEIILTDVALFWFHNCMNWLNALKPCAWVLIPNSAQFQSQLHTFLKFPRQACNPTLQFSGRDLAKLHLMMN